MPTTFGFTAQDTGNIVNATRNAESQTLVTLTEAGVVSKISVYHYGGTELNANVAIRADNAGAPGTLVASGTARTGMTADAWNDYVITATLSAGNYWLVYNNNGSNDFINRITYATTAGTSRVVASTYGTFPSTAPSGASTAGAGLYGMAMYATYATSASTPFYKTTRITLG